MLLRGRKRFRVAGRTVGSAVTIDHVLHAGDAMYIHAGTFHTGGESAQPSDSIMLSLALHWPTDAEAQAAMDTVAQWKRVRQSVLAGLSSEQDSWSWAGSVIGR